MIPFPAFKKQNGTSLVNCIDVKLSIDRNIPHGLVLSSFLAKRPTSFCHEHFVFRFACLCEASFNIMHRLYYERTTFKIEHGSKYE